FCPTWSFKLTVASAVNLYSVSAFASSAGLVSLPAAACVLTFFRIRCWAPCPPEDSPSGLRPCRDRSETGRPRPTQGSTPKPGLLRSLSVSYVFSSQKVGCNGIHYSPLCSYEHTRRPIQDTSNLGSIPSCPGRILGVGEPHPFGWALLRPVRLK